MFRRNPAPPPAPEDCLPGRSTAVPVADAHVVNGNPLVGPWPDGHETLVVGMGCFWGAERFFWQMPGVYTTAAGYAGGTTPNPTYEETCTSMTGHTEAVLVVFDPAVVSMQDLLKVFWENHDPTQFMGQGNDRGSQYRSAIYTTTDEQLAVTNASRETYQLQLASAGFGDITTEIGSLDHFYYAEDYHQQYLAKNPGGYCNHGFCQIAYTPVEGSIEAPTKVEFSTEDLRARLTDEQFQVTQHAGTERAFTGKYWDTKDDGTYNCVVCETPLFTSDTKYDSGTGWPSFTEAIDAGAVTRVIDRSHGMTRVEARCATCDAHLGHVFPDGPGGSGGDRFCMNSASLDLEMADELVDEMVDANE